MGSCQSSDDVDAMDYVYKLDYKKKKQQLTVSIIVCCGGPLKLFSDAQLSDTRVVPNGYSQEGAAFLIWFIEEDTPLGAKEIIVIVIICLLVIGAVAGFAYWYRQKRRRGQATFDESKNDEAGNKVDEEKKTTDGAMTTADGTTIVTTDDMEMKIQVQNKEDVVDHDGTIR